MYNVYARMYVYLTSSVGVGIVIYIWGPRGQVLFFFFNLIFDSAEKKINKRGDEEREERERDISREILQRMIRERDRQ